MKINNKDSLWAAVGFFVIVLVIFIALKTAMVPPTYINTRFGFSFSYDPEYITQKFEQTEYLEQVVEPKTTEFYDGEDYSMLLESKNGADILITFSRKLNPEVAKSYAIGGLDVINQTVYSKDQTKGYYYHTLPGSGMEMYQTSFAKGSDLYQISISPNSSFDSHRISQDDLDQYNKIIKSFKIMGAKLVVDQNMAKSVIVNKKLGYAFDYSNGFRLDRTMLALSQMDILQSAGFRNEKKEMSMNIFITPAGYQMNDLRNDVKSKKIEVNGNTWWIRGDYGMADFFVTAVYYSEKYNYEINMNYSKDPIDWVSDTKDLINRYNFDINETQDR